MKTADMVELTMLKSGSYSVNFHDLYARLWDLGEDVGDGTRHYISQGENAVKWVIADLSGTPAEKGRTLRDNNAIRAQAFATLTADGWADRINERTFRLLVPPTPAAESADEVPDPESLLVPLEDPDDHGTPVIEVDSRALTNPTGFVELGGVSWNDWVPLQQAAKDATLSPGVYLARVAGAVVYVGMAGERRGQGVRGRLNIYARGRGAVSGLGEAVLDRALADDAWVAGQLDDLRQHGPRRAKEWAASAFDRQPLDVAWSATDSAETARELERRVLLELADADLWNRARPRT